MIELDAATVLLQWAAGGWFFLWITTRRREVGLGYGWLMRGVFLAFAGGSLAVGLVIGPLVGRELLTGVMLATGMAALVVSIARRSAGVAGQRDGVRRRSARVAAMTGIDREAQSFDDEGSEFPPMLDLGTAVVGLLALIPAGLDAGDPALLALVRTLVGALFLGAVTDAMALGHWYLVQPGLARAPILELVRWATVLWPAELLVMLWPTGMVAVLNGTIDDGYGGLLGWFWAACAVTTIVLLVVTRAALREREYSAVMAATGLLYLAILTAFGMDLVARATLAG